MLLICTLPSLICWRWLLTKPSGASSLGSISTRFSFLPKFIGTKNPSPGRIVAVLLALTSRGYEKGWGKVNCSSSLFVCENIEAVKARGGVELKQYLPFTTVITFFAMW